MVSDSRAEHLLFEQNRVLRMLAEGRPVAVILKVLCNALENLMPGSVCSVLLLDGESGQLRHIASPSIAKAYSAAIDGVHIGRRVGSCGTAAYLNEPIVVTDVLRDPSWVPWKGLASQYGFRACWSVPIIDREAGQVVGTFGVYYQEPRAPSSDDLAMVIQWGDLAGVAIMHGRRQDVLLRAQDAIEAAEQAKRAFLAMANHELRTPLQAILGYAEFLLDDPRTPLTHEQRIDLEYIQQGGQRMLHIVNDLLDLARIEANSLQLRREVIDLGHVLEEVRQEMQPRAAQRGLGLHLLLPPAMPVLYTDAERLRQILLNLLNNAVKFTDAGSVEISVAVRGERVAVSVRDTGRGISPEALPLIFEAFQQVDKILTRRHGGAGLGLAIAQRLATLMDGQITVESVPGVGSTFTLHLPIVSVFGQSEPEPPGSFFP